MNNPSLANLAADTANNAFLALLNNGFLEIYGGTQPANADTAITTQPLLATLGFSATAFASSSGASANANTISSATASGWTAAHAMPVRMIEMRLR